MTIKVLIMKDTEVHDPELDFLDRFLDYVHDFEAPLKAIETNIMPLTENFEMLNKFVNTPIKQRHLQEALDESKLLSISQIMLYQRINRIANVIDSIRDQIRPS